MSLTAAVLVLAVFVQWDQVSSKLVDDPEMEAKVMTLFPGLFKTDGEVEAVREAQRRKDQLEIPGFEKPDFEKPDFEKPDFEKPDFEKPGFEKPESKITIMDRDDKERPGRPERPGGGVILHGCCKSERDLGNFSRLENIEGVMVEIVEFPNRKQYFQVDKTCETTPNCNFCGCAQERRLHTALCAKNNRIQFDLVYAPTVCRCYNNLPQGFRSRFEFRDTLGVDDLNIDLSQMELDQMISSSEEVFRSLRNKVVDENEKEELGTDDLVLFKVCLQHLTSEEMGDEEAGKMVSVMGQQNIAKLKVFLFEKFPELKYAPSLAEQVDALLSQQTELVPVVRQFLEAAKSEDVHRDEL